MAVSKKKRQRMSRSAVWLITVTVLIAAFLSLKMITLIKTEHYYADKEREVAADKASLYSRYMYDGGMFTWPCPNYSRISSIGLPSASGRERPKILA